MSARLASTLLSFLCVGLSAGGCGRSAEEGGGVAAVRDSAGIQIVENTTPAWPAGGGWQLAATPSTELGGGGPESDLVNVVGVARLPDRRIAVSTTHAIRFFDRDGKLLGVSGQQGSGPGEFQGLAGFWVGPGDSLLAADMMLQRMTVLDGAGTYARNFSLGGQAGLAMPSGGQFGMAIPVGQLGDGGVVGMRMTFDLTAERTGNYRDSVVFLRYDRSGAGRDTIGKLPGIEMTRMSITVNGQTVPAPTPVPLGKVTVTAVAGDRIYLAQNTSWEIEARNPDGSLRRLIRVAAPAAPVTAADIAAHKKEQIDLMEATPQFRGLPEQFKTQFMDRINSAAYPETRPWIVAMFPVPDGSLWVEEVVAPGSERRQYAIIAADGALQGRITAPPRFRVMAVYPDEVIGVWKDPDDLERVRAYPIVR